VKDDLFHLFHVLLNDSLAQIFCLYNNIVRLSCAVVGVPSKDLRGDDLHQQPELMTAQWPDVFIYLKNFVVVRPPGVLPASHRRLATKKNER